MDSQEVTVENRCLNIGGIKTQVKLNGTGRTLVLIHGLGGPLMWQRAIEPLSKNFHTVVIDLPGFGSTDPPERDFSTTDHAEFVHRCLNILGHASAILCGISYGGQVAATITTNHSTTVEKLILISSTGLMKSPVIIRNEVLWNFSKTIIKNTFLHNETLMCWMGARSFHSTDNRPSDLCSQFYSQLARNGSREAWLGTFRNSFSNSEHFFKMLSAVRPPSLIVWGKNDATVSPKYAEQFHTAVAGSKLIIYPECGHSVPLEKPTELCRDITEFCKT